MKKKKWLCLALIAVCLAVFFGYRVIDRLSTDGAAPQITFSGETLQLSVQDSGTALLRGVTARDKKDGDVTASLVVESIKMVDNSGTVSVTYAAFDKAGNVAKAERTCQFTDYESPRFSLNAPLAFSQNTSFDVLSVIGVEDMLDGDITHRVRATSLDDSAITSPGVHDVQFRVTNSLGETVELVLPVEVYLSGTYQGSLKLTDYLIYLPVGASFDAEDYLKEYTLNSDTTSLKGGLPNNFSLRTTGTVNTRTPGVYTVGYEVTYTRVYGTSSDYNQSYTGYSKLIVVVEG